MILILKRKRIEGSVNSSLVNPSFEERAFGESVISHVTRFDQSHASEIFYEL